MLKRTVVRLLLFGIPLGLSYWVTRPASPVTSERTFVVCAYSGERPGELRISVDSDGCPEREFNRSHESQPGVDRSCGEKHSGRSRHGSETAEHSLLTENSGSGCEPFEFQRVVPTH